ncbi:DMT family transporter [Albidovulum sediminicola]|uniref:DMT family transporter n=1 Tax=Albidovulum sediminicola TaxID=2984331 RepID=A0ABT2Z2F7_9RHOB|nr:DMT family transporter [Defluviimonas sp. WL0075]MCV2865210.1 DMT family transporter [Defluviimonas sp. WL0075]
MSSSDANSPLAGIAWMFVTGLSFVAVTATVRHLGTDLPAAEGAFIRFAFGLLFLAPSLVLAVRTGLPRAALPLVLGRGALHTMAVMLWFFAMARIPLAEVTAIGYLNPIVVTAGAALFLGEQIALRRIAAIGVALLGAIVVLRPGLREITPGHWAQLGAAVFFGTSYLLAKQLSGMVRPVALVAFLSLTVTIGLAPFAAVVWITPTMEQLFWLGIVAVFATLGHYTMTRAFAAAPLTVTQPVTFLQLVWATLMGALAFGEAVDPYVLAGGGMIIGAISYMTYREARLRRRVTPPAPEAARL